MLSFFLSVFKILSLSLIVVSLITMCMQLRGATQRPSSGAVAERSYPMSMVWGAAERSYPRSKVGSSSCALLEQPWKNIPRPR